MSRRVLSSGSEGVPQVRQSSFAVLTRESEENTPQEEADNKDPRGGLPRMKKRLVLLSHGDLAGERKMSDTESVDEVATLDSHSARLHRVRERLQGPQDRRVRSAIDVHQLPQGWGFSTTIKRFPERFNDNSGPLSTSPCCGQQLKGTEIALCWLWLARQCHEVERITVAGVETAGREAVMGAWDALSDVMRSWGVHTREDLSEWVHQQGFPRPRWGGHFSGRAQERLLTSAAMAEPRVGALRMSYVRVALQACRQGC